MTRDMYADFAGRYDLFFGGGFGEHNHERAGFFRRLFAENQVHSVLDCACGTGRDLHFFHTLGCEVTGSDISEAMLAQAKKNLAEQGLHLPLVKADYRELPQTFSRQFDAVVCLATAIAEVPGEAEALRAMRSMSGVLRDGGILVLTQGTSDKQWREKPRFILAVNAGDFSRLFVIDYFGLGATYNILDIFHDEKERGLKVFSIEYRQIYLRDDQETLLKEAGYRCVDFYGSFNFDRYDKELSNRLITVARK
ncbi:MAG: class I SAM-dependent methyltransferase [Chloroflexota bacterium]